MDIEEDNGFKVRNLVNDNLSHASKDTYLICQRLDRIIKLLEARVAPKRELTFTPEYFNPPPTGPACPKCGNPGGLSKPRAALGEPIMAACAPCGYAWIDTGDIR